MPKRGGRWRDHGEVTDAIAFKLQTGKQWVHLRRNTATGEVPISDCLSTPDGILGRLAHVDLTTVGQGTPRPAALAVGRAIARMEAEAARGPETVIAPRLVVRATTAAPRRALP